MISETKIIRSTGNAGGTPISIQTRSGGTGASSAISDAAKRGLLTVKGDPFLLADWERVMFFHYLFDQELLRAAVPEPFELELYHGKACASLVAVTMRRFRPRAGSVLGWLFRPIKEQRLLNLRAYVRCGEESGALFLWGWLSRPFAVPLPSSLFGLCYSFASLNYGYRAKAGELRGQACLPGSSDRFTYRAKIAPQAVFEPCPSGSLAEFAMERYSGFFCRGQDLRVFRAWHPPWMQVPAQPVIEDSSLITNKFPWFSHGALAGASVAASLPGVWLGRPHPLGMAGGSKREPHRSRSAFLDMP